MTALLLQSRTLTELDHARLVNLLRRTRADSGLQELLENAELVPSESISPDIVTMYSQVLLVDPDDGGRRQLTVCYPSDAEPEKGFVSVLSPIGSALLGAQVGSVASWRTPAQALREAEIVAILFQPEASGDYLM